jgi:hypothetical protein
VGENIENEPHSPPAVFVGFINTAYIPCTGTYMPKFEKKIEPTCWNSFNKIANLNFSWRINKVGVQCINAQGELFLTPTSSKFFAPIFSQYFNFECVNKTHKNIWGAM